MWLLINFNNTWIHIMDEAKNCWSFWKQLYSSLIEELCVLHKKHKTLFSENSLESKVFYYLKNFANGSNNDSWLLKVRAIQQVLYNKLSDWPMGKTHSGGFSLKLTKHTVKLSWFLICGSQHFGLTHCTLTMIC